MTTLLTITSAKALHLPTPTSSLLPLSSGDLTLTLLPANPPLQTSETLTLTIGSSAFPLSTKGRIQRIKAKEEHASYMFTPMPAGAEGESVGQVVVQMKNSTSQTEWDATEAVCKQFEDILKKYNLWDEKVHFVNDEYDTAGEPVKGWGETVAEAVTNGASFVAGKITSFAETHISNTPTSPSHPSAQTSNLASTLRSTSASLASGANTGATWPCTQAHDIGVAVNTHLPQSVRETIHPPEEKKGDVRRGVEEEWEQVTIAAGGVAGAAGTVAGTVGDEGHKVIRNDYGKEADDVAKDIGATGTNIGSTALSATEATSAIVHAGHAANGAYQGQARQ